MTTPDPGPEETPSWPNSGDDPSPEFLAAFQDHIRRIAASQADPLSPMDMTFVAGHTLFESAVRAGFTERQAIMATVEILMRQA